MDTYIRSRFIQAIDKFNEKNFFECHEILEDIWFDVRDDSRNFYQGLLHIAVGFYHLTKKHNPKGAIIQLNKAISRLTPYESNYNGINLSVLLNQIQNIKANLEENKLPSRFPKIILE